MILNGADVLVISAIDGASLGTVLEIAKDEGIPVIAYDRLIMETDAVSYYATFDNYMVGTIQGKYLVEALDLDNRTDPVNIEITAGAPDDNNARYFYQGAMDQLMPCLLYTSAPGTRQKGGLPKGYCSREIGPTELSAVLTHY